MANCTAQRRGDLTCTLLAQEGSDTHAQNGLVCELEYNVALFDHATMEQLFEQYHNLLDAIVVNPNAHIGSLALTRDRSASSYVSAYASPADQAVGSINIRAYS